MSYFDNNHVDDEHGGIFFYLLLIIASAMAALYYAPEASLPYISRYLLVDEEPVPSNAIVVLLGGDTPNRVLKAYQLLQQGYAPSIVYASGYSEVEKSSMKYPSGLDWPKSSFRYTWALRSLGVHHEDLKIIDIPAAFDTAHELAGIAKHARRHGWKKVLLVTSQSHTRRTSVIWNRVAPDITARVIAAPQRGFQTWWQQSYSFRYVAYEYAALMKEFGRQFYEIGNIFADSVEEYRDTPQPAGLR